MRRASVPLLLVLLAACGGDRVESPSDTGRDFAVERSFSGGPVTLVVRLTTDEIGLAEDLVLEEEVRFESGLSAELPEFEPAEFDGFGVVDVDEDPPAVRGGVTVLTRRLTLEPERSGELEIPVREAWFHREGEDDESSVASEAIAVTVRPIEDAEAVAWPEARSVISPEDVAEVGGSSAWWWLLLGVPVLAVGGWLLLRRRGTRAPPRVPAHELAWEALRRLAAARLLESGEVERFFVVLSAILREYVERRFGVRAPERTTREFLAEASSHPHLAEHGEVLGAFLGLADRVKFARHDPAEADIQAAFDRTREFITITQEADDA